MQHFDFVDSIDNRVNLLFYPFWLDEYTNDEYLKALTSDGVQMKSTKKEFQPCSIDVNILNKYLKNDNNNE